MDQLVALGSKEYAGLECVVAPCRKLSVHLESDEVTALCPVTGQPDWYRVTVDYTPIDFILESKSFKLFLHGFRDQGIFCEALAGRIREAVAEITRCAMCAVTVEQKPRGGVKIIAKAWQ